MYKKNVIPIYAIIVKKKNNKLSLLPVNIF